MKTEKINWGLDILQKAKVEWNLVFEGEHIITGYNLLQPVQYENQSATVKVPLHKEKQAEVPLLLCWDGEDAIKIFKYNKDAFLIERVAGKRSLKNMLMNGQEDEANCIICSVVNRLHESGCQQIPELIPLSRWFKSLEIAAEKYGGLFWICRKTAEELLSNPPNRASLHGGIHYDNIIDSESRGWLAIDPKGLVGERGFDFANIFCNPDFTTAVAPGRLSKQSKRIAKYAHLDLKRLLQWIIAWSGLSASWMLEDEVDPGLPTMVAMLAIQELETL